MIIRLLRFMRGYLDIRLDGVYSEQILTRLSKEKITVWKLRYSAGVIYCRITVKDYKKLRKLRKNTGVRVHIISKRGFPFFAKKYNKRVGFMAGAIIFLILLNYLSGFIWVINISGNKQVKSEDIMRSLNEIGITETMKSKNIDPKNMALSLLLSRNDLAWASLNIEGSVLNVNVTEIVKKTVEDDPMPSNLVASEDGIIQKVDAVSGDVRVKVGQNVHKGEILVSGIVENLSTTVFVKSNAQIIAQVEESFSEKAEYKRKEKEYFDGIKRENVLSILGVNIPLFIGGSKPKADITYDVRQTSLFGRKVPIKLYVRNYRYFRIKESSYSEDALKKRLSDRLQDFLSNSDIAGYIPLSTDFFSDADGVTVKHRYLCEKNIAVESKIIMGQ